MRLMLIIVLLLPLPARGEEPQCKEALRSCLAVTQEQDSQIQHLKAAAKQLEAKAVENEPPLLPWYVWAVVGVSVGAVLGAKVGR